LYIDQSVKVGLDKGETRSVKIGREVRQSCCLSPILHKTKGRKVTWIGHILPRNCLLKHVIEGKLEGRIEMTGRRGRRRKQLLDDLKENKVTGN
jgi:hypothetical protein